MEDIAQRRSLREILPSKNNKIKTDSVIEGNPPPGDMPEAAFKRRRGPKILMWFLAAVTIVFILIILSSVFSRVTVDIVPRQGRIILKDEIITASRAATAGELEFGLVSSDIAEETTVPAAGTEKVERKASGQITIFNNFDDNPQELVATTRFESPDGKIYRIPEAVTVPGMKTVDNQAVPGSIEVTVFADQPGADYNIGLVDFIIPGFADGPRFEGFFARSKTPMAGGFVGEVKTVADDDEKQARAELRQKLSGQTSELKPQVPNDFILFDDALISSFESLPITPNQNTAAGEALIREKAVATGILFNKKELSAYLARQFISDYDNEEVQIANFDELEFKLNNKSGINTATVNELTFTLSGNAHIVWVVDADTFRDSIRGLNKEEFQNIISRFPAIESVTPRFWPPWRGTIPDNPDKIKVRLSVER